MQKRYILWFGLLAIVLLLFDYFNLPTLLGLEASHMNWELLIGILNTLVVVSLYFFTYKILDEKTIMREQNKNEISALLLTECYNECKKFACYLSQETVEKHVIPKIDFNATINKDSIIDNVKTAPFLNENIVMDFAKDGQLSKSRVEGYFKVKSAYSQYILMRIVLFDAPMKYEPLRMALLQTIDIEEEKLQSNV